MGPAMPPVTALMVIVPCMVVISLPALLCHALLRNYWLASAAIWLLSFASGYAVARVCRFPVEHLAFGLIASVIGLATGLLVGIPFVLHRRGWLANYRKRLTSGSVPEIEPIRRTKRLKEEHRRWRNRMAGVLVAWFIAGIVVALTTWMIQEPMYRDWAMFSGVLGLGLAILCIGGMLTRLLFPKPEAKCPQCGQHWREAEPNDDWLSWKCCPGCGLQMSDEPGWQETT